LSSLIIDLPAGSYASYAILAGSGRKANGLVPRNDDLFPSDGGIISGIDGFLQLLLGCKA
jgi:hypothetical protein